MRYARLLTAAAGLLALSACATHKPPPALKAPVLVNWTTQAGAAEREVRMDWWSDLRDPVLDSLVKRALAHNADVGVATANYRAALALAGEAGALRGLVGSVEGALVETRVPAGAQPPGSAPGQFSNQTLAQIGATLSWEVDLFGGVEAAIDAARSDSQGALWARRGVEAAVAGAVVKAWIDYRATAGIELALTQRLAVQADIVARLERGVALGGVTRAELEAARAQLEIDRAELPPLQAQRRNAARRVAVLTGEAPRITVDGTDPTQRLYLPTALYVDEPASVLRRRPDVALAEAQVAAAAARAGVARAALYPRISLVGSGQLAADPGEFGNAGAFGFTFGPRLQWGILDFQRVSARIAAADAQAEGAAFAWERTALSALEEADAALDGWSQARAATVNLRRAYGSTVLAVADMRQRVASGAEGEIALSRAQTHELLAEAALRAGEYRELQAWAMANLALGAGWRDVGLASNGQRRQP